MDDDSVLDYLRNDLGWLVIDWPKAISCLEQFDDDEMIAEDALMDLSQYEEWECSFSIMNDVYNILNLGDLDVIPTVAVYFKHYGDDHPNGVVEGLILNNQHLGEDNLPSVLQELKHLRYLSLDSNSLRKVPEWVFNLKKLEFLVLSDNLLDDIGEEITRLENLRFLFLCNNRLRKIPESVGRLKRLEGLFLDKNPLTELNETLLGLSDTLRYLFFSDTRVSEFPRFFMHMKKLQFIGLKRTPIKWLPFMVYYRNASEKYFRWYSAEDSEIVLADGMVMKDFFELDTAVEFFDTEDLDEKSKLETYFEDQSRYKIFYY